MTTDTTLTRVTRLLADRLGKDPASITPESHIIDDLGADSLDTYEIVMAAEDEFGCELPDSVAESIATVADFVAVIEGMGK